MAHKIEIINGVASMAYAKDGGKPWHGLGTSVEEAMTLTQAITLGGLDWGVEKRPLFVELINPETGKRTTKRFPGKFATVRITDNALLGIVDEVYQPDQNLECFKILEEVFQEMGLEPRYETAMSLDGGKQVVITARMPKDVKVGKSDVLWPYLMCRNGHDGNTALDFIPTHIRPVCYNTSTAAVASRGAVGSAGYGVTLWHRGNKEERIKIIKTQLALALRQQDEFEKTANKLADIEATAEMESWMLAAVLPVVVQLTTDHKTPRMRAGDKPWAPVRAVPEKMFDRAIAGRVKKVDIFKDIRRQEDGSAWGLFNTATGYIDHGRTRQAQGESRFKQLVMGEAAAVKSRAWTAIQDLAGLTV